jgi:hypothetical protein
MRVWFGSSVAFLLLAMAGRAAAYDEPSMCSEPVDEHPWSSADAQHDVCIASDPSLELMLPARSEADTHAARAAFERAEALYRSGDVDQAVLHLRVVERALPRIEDRIALRRGALLEPPPRSRRRAACSTRTTSVARARSRRWCAATRTSASATRCACRWRACASTRAS